MRNGKSVEMDFSRHCRIKLWEERQRPSKHRNNNQRTEERGAHRLPEYLGGWARSCAWCYCATTIHTIQHTAQISFDSF